MNCARCDMVVKGRGTRVRYCPRCGALLDNWRQNPLAIGIWLTCFPPFGVWLVGQHPRWSSPRKLIVAAAGVVWFLFLCLLILGLIVNNVT